MSELSGGVMLTENALRCVARSIEMFYKKKAQNRDWCITTVRNAADQFEKMREEISTLRAQPANEPLTLEQLREMDGEPVWVTHKDGSGGRWGIVNSYKGTGMCADLDSYTAYWFDGWCGTIAYRRKPERSEQE